MTTDLSSLANEAKTILRDAARRADDMGLAGTADFLRGRHAKIGAAATPAKVREVLSAAAGALREERDAIDRDTTGIESEPRARLQAASKLLSGAEGRIWALLNKLPPAPSAEERPS